MIQRSFYSLFSEDPASTAEWYRSHFGFEVTFDSDWFVHLRAPANELLELGIIDRSHEIVPEAHRLAPAGGMLTLVVDDVDEVHRRLVADGHHVIEEPRDLFYGQRRMLLADPTGALVDVSSECEPDPEWLASLS